MKRTAAVICLLFILLPILSPAIVAGPLSELILFASKDSKYYQIYSVRPDGRDMAKIVNIKSDCREPSLCQETEEIVFSVLESQTWHIYKTDLNGSFIQRLTNSHSSDRHPSWSPDGSEIVFETTRWGQTELAVMDSNGANIRRITHNQTVNRFPMWSPNGEKLLFISWMQGSSDIYVIDPFGKTRAKRLTKNFFPDVTPSWAPDSMRIVYGCHDHASRFIAIQDIGGNIRKLRKDTEKASYPAWSPDGTKILFVDSEKETDKLKTISLHDEAVSDFPIDLPGRTADLIWQNKKLPWE